MVIWAWLLASLMIGFGLGAWVSKSEIRKNCAGTLREDHSDPTEAPYLFLELEPGGLDKIHKSKTVNFQVKIENYIPRR